MPFTTSEKNTKKCEICNGENESKFERTQIARNCNQPYAKHRVNRQTIGNWYKIEALGEFKNWIGKKVCSVCYHKFMNFVNSHNVY